MSGFSLFLEYVIHVIGVVTTVTEGISKVYIRYTRSVVSNIFYFRPSLGGNDPI